MLIPRIRPPRKIGIAILEIALTFMLCVGADKVFGIFRDSEERAITYADAFDPEHISECYESATGTIVWLHDSAKTCPKKEHFDKAEAKYMRRYKATVEELQPHSVVFVGERIACNVGHVRVIRDSCTNGTYSVVKRSMLRVNWSDSLHEEMGHVLSWRRHKDLDQDHRRRYYPHNH